MSTKNCRFTFTPSTPGALVIQRESDGFFRDAVADDGSFAVTKSAHTATESATIPGMYLWSTSEVWADDVYRFLWYEDGTWASAPTVLGALNIVSDEEPAEAIGVDAASVRAALGMASADLDSQLSGIAGDASTAAANVVDGDSLADSFLARDLGSGTNAGTLDERTVRAALRFLRNKWALVGTTLTVTKENDVDTAWTSTVTADASADPITGSDPT